MEEEGMRIKRMDQIKDDPAKVEDLLKKGTLGNKLGLLRAMGSDHAGRVKVGEAILTELLSRHRRIDHREHPLMIGYFSNLGFEVAHLNTGDGDMKGGTTSVERKEDDFMDSLFDDRWLRQLGAMREEAEHSYLIITKSYEDIKNEVHERGVSEQVLTGFVAALCAVGYTPLFVPDKWDAAVIVRKIMDKIDDDTARLYVPDPAHPRRPNTETPSLRPCRRSASRPVGKSLRRSLHWLTSRARPWRTSQRLRASGRKPLNGFTKYFMRNDYIGGAHRGIT